MIYLKNKPVVSVITPIFNGISFIDRVIDTVIIQNVECEHIFIDDCSTDGTYEYLLSLSAKYNHIIILRNDHNLGPSHSRNHGISISTGKFIAFLDVDDLWNSNKLSSQINFMLKNNFVISATGFRKISPDGRKLSSVISRSSSISYFSHLSTRYICCSSVIIDSSIISSFSFPILDKWLRVDDFYAWSCLINQGFEFSFLSQDLVRYTVIKNSRSSKLFMTSFSVIYLYIFYEKANFITKIISLINYILFSFYKIIFFRICIDRKNIDF
jgi:teichuronic acid biosynthesis glycosyltransferase TuaG